MKHQKWSNDHIDYIRPVELSDIELLAEGGFGNVYVARWQKGDRNVALKIVHTEWPRAQTLFEMRYVCIKRNNAFAFETLM